jgi:tetratricopeptide (TPR) repeat protein
MKRIIPFFIILTILFSGCGSSKKQLSKGNYDAAIEKAVKALRKDREDEKQIQILSESYRIANELDQERIRYLKMEGLASSWDEIFQIYQALSARQTLVRTVTPLKLNGSTVDFPYTDYMTEMVEAKRKAADFYFAHGNQLMDGKIKENYRHMVSL